MLALKDVSKVWLVAKMVHTLFESILGNKVLEERLQKAAGKRHQRARHDHNGQAKKADPPKRKFDEMDIDLHSGGPTPPVSYERSRPQTPAVTPSRELRQPPQGATSPNTQRAPQEPVCGPANSRGNTRPTTPFNNQFPLPATPPDFYLVTRTSPNLSPSLWENFQPDQLFPDGAAIFSDLTSPPPATVDPQLQMPSQLQVANLPQRPMMGTQPSQAPGRTMSVSQGSPHMMSGLPSGMGMPAPQAPQQMFGMEGQQPWPISGLDGTMSGAAMDAASQDDNWSSSSRSGPTAPTTLNVEDWYVFSVLEFMLRVCTCSDGALGNRFQFFGINGGFGDLAA